MRKPIMTICSVLFILLSLKAHAATGQAAAAPIQATWESVGIGGGGGIFNPSISPHDHRLIFVSCDMGGLYRSTDGGASWQMADGQAVRKILAPVCFHPTLPDVVYAATRGGVKVTHDRGTTWHHLVGNVDTSDPDCPTAIAVDPGRPGVIWVHFDTYLGTPGHFLIRSTDGGRSWNLISGWLHRDRKITKIIFNPLSPLNARQVFVLAGGELYRSDDDGASWQLKTASLPPADAASDCVAAWDRRRGAFSLFITRPSREEAYQPDGGVYKSTDAGDTWQPAVQGLELRPYRGRRQQYQHLTISPENPNIVYVSSKGPGLKPPFSSTIWKSTDGGGRWHAILFGAAGDPNHNVAPDWLSLALTWGWGGCALGLTCDPGNPQDVIVTDAGRAFQTIDGGRRWFPIYTHRLRPDGDAWQGRGLEVTTDYTFYFDPHDAQRNYITYTDIGMARSLDGGNSWIWAGRGSPWPNTCYELALDPDRPGVLFGAWAGAHDLPHWKMLRHGPQGLNKFSGGLARSVDFGATWSRIGRRSLPNAAATTIILDRHTRTLYAGFFNKGIYKSTDDGKTWSLHNNGLAPAENMNIWRLALHPDGTLLCAKTIAYIKGRPVPGGLYRSVDHAAKWVKVNVNQPLDYIFGVRMDPRDSRIIYVACFDVPPDGFTALATWVPWPPSRGGGIFKTMDGGRTWKKILDQPYSWDVSFDPRDPDIVYAGTFLGGLYRSTDAGMTWRPITGLPFVCPQRVTVDPRNSKVIYVTTFGGGVWKGRLP
jgi:photosystem II stability/assembly factor-like uncharacterized protein